METDEKEISEAIMSKTKYFTQELGQIVSELSQSYSYMNLHDILILIAQENNVIVSKPNEYLYVVLEYKNYPITMNFIPFTTISKKKMKQTIIQHIRIDMIEKKREIMFDTNNFSRILRYVCSNTSEEERSGPGREGYIERIYNTLFIDYTFMAESEVIAFNFYCKGVNSCRNLCYECNLLTKLTIDEVLNEFKIKKVVKDYRIVKVKGVNYLPISLLSQNAHPEWEHYLGEGRPSYGFKFPYLSFESLSDKGLSPGLWIQDYYLKKVTNYEMLQKGNHLEYIDIETLSLESLDFPPEWKLPYLESFRIHCKGLTSLSLDFLKNSPLLQSVIIFHTDLKIFDLSALQFCPNLEEITIEANRLLETIDLTPLRFCLNLKRLNLSLNRIKKIDLTPLRKCVNLKTLCFNGNKLEDVDFSPLRDCKNLEYIGFEKQVFPMPKREEIETKFQKKILEANIKNIPKGYDTGFFID